MSPFIGDDCAVIRPAGNQDLLFTTDLTIEGVHFTREMRPEHVGHRACARSLSDIAAMGGTPKYCLVSLAFAPWTDQRWIDRFYRGLNALLRSVQATIAGGDISHAAQLMCDIMMCGSVPKGGALLRSGAKVGHALYVSGDLGGWTHRPFPHPRLDAGRKLLGKASACIDISDGLALDLQRLCKASGVAAELETVPVLPGATLQQALHDGEDYELLFTVPPGMRAPGKRIGQIVKGSPGAVRFQGKPLPARGYDHFRHRR